MQSTAATAHAGVPLVPRPTLNVGSLSLMCGNGSYEQPQPMIVWANDVYNKIGMFQEQSIPYSLDAGLASSCSYDEAVGLLDETPMS